MKKLILVTFIAFGMASIVSAQSFTLFHTENWGTILWQNDHPYNGDRDSILHYNISTFTQPGDASFVFLNDLPLKSRKGRNTLQDVFYQFQKGKTWCLLTQQPGASGMGSVYTMIVDVIRKDNKMVELILQDNKGKKTKRLIKLPF